MPQAGGNGRLSVRLRGSNRDTLRAEGTQSIGLGTFPGSESGTQRPTMGDTSMTRARRRTILALRIQPLGSYQKTPFAFHELPPLAMSSSWEERWQPAKTSSIGYAAPLSIPTS